MTFGATYGALATTTRTGYSFAGWWTAAGGTGTEVTAATTVAITAAQTLYAKWTAASYTVTFDAQGGTAATPASKSVTFGATYGALATTTRTGYSFAGWWTGAAGTGVQVTATTVVATAANQILYAKYVSSSSNGPDLVVANIVVSPEVPAVGGRFTATITVLNQGNQGGKKGKLQVWVNKPETAAVGEAGDKFASIPALKPGQSRTVRLTLTAPKALGTFTLRAFVDATNVTVEADESNNQQTHAYDTGLPDFKILDVRVSPETPAAGQSFTAYVTVTNVDEVAGNGGYLEVWTDSSVLADIPVAGSTTKGGKYKSVGTLQPGQEKIIRVTGLKTPTDNPAPVLGVLIDSRAKTQELDEDNNWFEFPY